jgi:hypothetical protein
MKKSAVMLSVLMFISVYGMAQNAQIPNINTNRITIARDTYGVPHIFAPTDPEVAYGLAWAHSEDDFKTIQTLILTGKGKLSTYLGKKGAPIDFVFGLLNTRKVVDEQIKDMDPKFLQLLQGYLNGLEAYAKAHPKEVLNKHVFPIQIEDYISEILALLVDHKRLICRRRFAELTVAGVFPHMAKPTFYRKDLLEYNGVNAELPFFQSLHSNFTPGLSLSATTSIDISTPIESIESNDLLDISTVDIDFNISWVNLTSVHDHIVWLLRVNVDLNFCRVTFDYFDGGVRASRDCNIDDSEGFSCWLDDSIFDV